MDYHFDRSVRINPESEFKSLYRWSLQEFDEASGKQIGPDWVPFQWRVWLSISELRHVRSIGFESPAPETNDDGKEAELDDIESADSSLIDVIEEKTDANCIAGIAHTGICRDGKELDGYVRLSFFGTKRIINNVHLRIYRLDPSVNASTLKPPSERCHVSGFPSYTTEIDFRYETSPDHLELTIFLDASRYDDIADMVINRRVDHAQISISRVSGFYAEWSPEISAREIKILPTGDDIKIHGISDHEIIVPRLKKAGEFDLQLTQRNFLKINQNFEPSNVYHIFEEEISDNEIENQSTPAQVYPSTISDHAATAQSLAFEKKLVNSIKVPLWLIFFALIMIMAMQY